MCSYAVYKPINFCHAYFDEFFKCAQAQWANIAKNGPETEIFHDLRFGKDISAL